MILLDKKYIKSEERFWSKVNKTESENDCWLWTGGKFSRGYGQFIVTGCYIPKRAHRISFEMYNGPIPKGVLVRHKCDNKLCVNPRHLILGDHADNKNDSVKNNRHHKQISRFTKEQAEEMKRLHFIEGKTLKTVGLIFGVTDSMIGLIVKDRINNFKVS
jgi:hypothetical protein